jgi:hypothetical protein
VVVVGKVDGLEPQDVKVGDLMYRIATVKVNDGIKGVKGDVKTIRVGFIHTDAKPPKIRPGLPRPVQLEAGQEGLFLLSKHGSEDFYTIGGPVGFFFDSKTFKDLDKEVQAAKAAVKVLDKPAEALKAKDIDERVIAAAILIEKYRGFAGPKQKQEPIDADESKLILQTLIDADWQTSNNFTSLRVSPTQLFQRLGVNQADGFMVAPGNDFSTVAKNWLRENAGKYRIQRNVAEK